MMSLKKIALSSLLLLCCSFLIIQRVIHSKYNISVRELVRVLNAPASCQTTQIMNINFLDEDDIQNHVDSTSKLYISGVGEYTGSDRIKEAIKVQKSSFTEDFDGYKSSDASKVYAKEDRYFEFLEESTDDECVIAAGTIASLKMGNCFKGGRSIKTSVNGKFKFKMDMDGSLIFSEVSVALPDDLPTTLASKINPTKAAGRVCETMKQHCVNTWEKDGFDSPNGMNKCKRAFKKLPSGKTGKTDGNTQACRIFRAAIVETSGDSATTACAALSFNKIKGEDGCRDEDVIKPEDVFGQTELAYFSDFKKKKFSDDKGFLEE